MAETEAHDLAEHVKEAEGANGVQEGGSHEESASKAADAKQATAVASKPASRGATPALPSPGSGLVPLRGSSSNSAAPTLSMPHPKKFSHVDINKRFLEKNSQVAGGSHTPAASTVTKAASSVQKPVLSTAPSHSRLVTAKLTTDTQRLATAGPGWSRPPSTSSSVAGAPAASSSAKPSPAPTPSTSHGPLQPAPVGKVIQPQPRTADAPALVRKDGSSKPAWRSSASAMTPTTSLDGVQNEFPTAAEVAQVRSAKQVEKKQNAQAVAAQKQAMAADADAFRGVHLGPNVHHWDEDEGDDSNFLDEVIEFEDGRQYTIPQAKDESAAPDTKDPSAKESEVHDVPVSKEERFADDFDRSWPRSRNMNGHQNDRHGAPLLSPSAASSQSLHSPSLHSPQEQSRVLFNERSNRLEPYSSHPPNRFSGSPREPFGRRGSRSDAGPPADFRGGRDAPPHTAGVQLLQKSSPSDLHDEGPSRSRIFGDRGGFDGPQEHGRFRDRDFGKRDSQPFGHRPSHGPEFARPPPNGQGMPPPIGPPDRSRRYSNMGPPPLPHQSPQEGRDGRQLPPHLSGAHPPPSMWRAPSTSERSRRLSAASSVSQTPVSPEVAHAPPPPPAVAQASASPVAPEPSQPAPAIPLMDLDEARKAAMHSAAERARLRRQQEEEEREKERERARKKAAELEAKLKAAEEEKAKAQAAKAAEAQAVAVIEDAVRSVAPERPVEAQPSKAAEPSTPSIPPTPRTLFGRAPSARGAPRPVPERRTSTAPTTPAVSSPAMEAETWRSKVVQPPAQPPPVKQSTPLPLLEQVNSFAISMDENVEVVDFSEHGKLIGVSPEEASPTQPTESEPILSRKPARPQAADFFQDDEDASQKVALLATTKSDEGLWRRKVSPIPEDPVATEQTPEKPKLQISPTLYHASPVTPHDHDRRPKELAPLHPSHSQSHPPIKSPLTPSYREAPMSALDDTMARIKGALDGMHNKPMPKQKWLPPALRSQTSANDISDHQHQHEHDEDREVFDVTGLDPPRSPKPAWNHFSVRLPRASTGREPVPPKRMRLFSAHTQTRLEVLSLAPPGGNKRVFHMMDILFPRPPLIRGRQEYRVLVPKPSRTQVSEDGLVVNLPPSARPLKTPTAGAFGRPREADGVSSWRKPPPSPLREKDMKESMNGLDTVSRSPPPEPPMALPGPSSLSPSSPTVSVPPAKGKALSKVPNGSGVAFYRDSRVESADGASSTAVNFIVNSELDGEVPADESRSEKPSFALTVTSTNDMTVAFPMAEAKQEDARRSASTSKTTSPWVTSHDIAKEGASNDTIPEHVKALWSSKSNKTESPSQNLLEGIADDLAAVPFTAPEAKLDEPNTTMPAAPAMQSRMSSQEVARAFQQVPNSPANSAKAIVSSPSQHHRQPAAPMPGSMLPPGARAVYPNYPPSMMSSPSPTLGYPPAMTPSPVPRPMVASPHYPPQPMWVPVPPPNGHPGMMRPMASPYGAQLMPYPPAGAMPMYAPPPPGMQGTPPHANGVHGRPPGVMMSPHPPQAQAAHPMYMTSPVLVHAMPGMHQHHPPGQPYSGPAAQGRPPAPPRGSYDGAPGMMQPPPPPFGSQPPSAYPVPPNSYVRTAW